ncbi:hypothetical protein NIES4074_58250 [Cylindrospermum sp. NIES-4074]|nr:hypothetical protein NIES4074_58250 [Cylindrospermum sp. NIES-4074]
MVGASVLIGKRPADIPPLNGIPFQWETYAEIVKAVFIYLNHIYRRGTAVLMRVNLSSTRCPTNV